MIDTIRSLKPTHPSDYYKKYQEQHDSLKTKSDLEVKLLNDVKIIQEPNQIMNNKNRQKHYCSEKAIIPRDSIKSTVQLMSETKDLMNEEILVSFMKLIMIHSKKVSLKQQQLNISDRLNSLLKHYREFKGEKSFPENMYYVENQVEFFKTQLKALNEKVVELEKAFESLLSGLIDSCPFLKSPESLVKETKQLQDHVLELENQLLDRDKKLKSIGFIQTYKDSEKSGEELNSLLEDREKLFEIIDHLDDQLAFIYSEYYRLLSGKINEDMIKHWSLKFPQKWKKLMMSFNSEKSEEYLTSLDMLLPLYKDNLIHTKTQEFDMIQYENNLMKQDLSDLEKMKNDFEEISRKYESQNETIGFKNVQLFDLCNKLKEQDSYIKNLEDKAFKSQMMVNEKELEFQYQIDGFEDCIKDKVGMITALERELLDEKIKFEKWQSECEEVEEIKAVLHKEKSISKDHSKVITSLKEKIDGFEQKNNENEELISGLKAKLKDQEERYDVLKIKHDEMSLSNTTLLYDKNAFQEEINKLQSFLSEEKLKVSNDKLHCQELYSKTRATSENRIETIDKGNDHTTQIRNEKGMYILSPEYKNVPVNVSQDENIFKQKNHNTEAEVEKSRILIRELQNELNFMKHENGLLRSLNKQQQDKVSKLADEVNIVKNHQHNPNHSMQNSRGGDYTHSEISVQYIKNILVSYFDHAQNPKERACIATVLSKHLNIPIEKMS